MTHSKFARMKEEYAKQCATLLVHRKHFRKLGRHQIQERALRRSEMANTDTDGDGDGELADGMCCGTKALVMTDELCGIFYKINRCNRLLKMNEVYTPRELLI